MKGFLLEAEKIDEIYDSALISFRNLTINNYIYINKNYTDSATVSKSLKYYNRYIDTSD